MTKHFQFIATLLLILATAGQTIYGQTKAITFKNDLNAYYNQTRPKDTLKGLAGFRFFEPKIYEITLNPDATFEFWSRPNWSCHTWHSYKGTWKRDKDTIFFYDKYEVDELTIAPFIDSIRLKILSDTILFDTSNLRHFNYLSTNSKSYSPLFIIDFKYEYALDIINAKLVLEFVNEFLNPDNIKSIDVIDPQSSDALFYKYGKLGVIIIYIKRKAKVNYKVAGLRKVYRKSMSTNFDQNPPGQGRWFY